jgi:hypothetical protein
LHRLLHVHLLAVLGSLFLIAALFPERIGREIVMFCANLCAVFLITAVVTAAQEWRWHRRLMQGDWDR